jgi:hypothetical protein
VVCIGGGSRERKDNMEEVCRVYNELSDGPR